MQRPNEVIIMQPTGGMHGGSPPGQDLVAHSGEGRMWKHDLLDCCSDKKVCCLGFFYPGCLMCRVMHSMDECGYCVCIFGSAVAAIWSRARIRSGLHIKGSFCGDLLCSMCCTSLVACQMYKELKDNGQLVTKICKCDCDGEKQTYCK